MKQIREIRRWVPWVIQRLLEHAHTHTHTQTLFQNDTHTSTVKVTALVSVHVLFSFMQLKWTPLYAAVHAGHMKIVQCLIEEKGCDSAVLDAVS